MCIQVSLIIKYNGCGQLANELEYRLPSFLEFPLKTAQYRTTMLANYHSGIIYTNFANKRIGCWMREQQ